MAVTVASLISTCPAPVSDASGITNAKTWLATCNVFALESTRQALCNKDAIANNSEIYLLDIPYANTTPTAEQLYDVNDKLYHIKDMLSGWNAVHT